MATGIKWADETLNLVVGCTKISPGCKNCYAKTVTERWPSRFSEGFSNVTLKPDRLAVPYGWRKPRRVFVNSMSDTFHDAVPDWYLQRMWDLFSKTPLHTYMVLTKRPERMAALFEDGVLWFLPNVWLGVSAENQMYWNERVKALAICPAPVHFVSCEPLIGAIDPWELGHLVNWIICGGESGPTRRQMDPAWARELRDYCHDLGKAFFFKQGNALHAGHDDLLDGQGYKEFPDG